MSGKTRISFELIQNYLFDKPNEDYSQSPLKLKLLRDMFDSDLTKKQKSYIMLYYRDGVSETEIARRMGVNKSTVSRTINRAKQRLLKSLKLNVIRKDYSDFLKGINGYDKDTDF